MSRVTSNHGHCLIWRPGAECSWLWYTARNSFCNQLACHTTNCIGFLCRTSAETTNVFVTVNKRLNYVLCYSISTLNKAVLGINTVLHKERERELGLNFQADASLLQQSERLKGYFLLVTFLVVCYFHAYEGAKCSDADNSYYCKTPCSSLGKEKRMVLSRSRQFVPKHHEKINCCL